MGQERGNNHDTKERAHPDLSICIMDNVCKWASIIKNMSMYGCVLCINRREGWKELNPCR